MEQASDDTLLSIPLMYNIENDARLSSSCTNVLENILCRSGETAIFQDSQYSFLTVPLRIVHRRRLTPRRAYFRFENMDGEWSITHQ